MISTIDESNLQMLKTFLKAYRYDCDVIHCYYGHIPHVAFILLVGQAILSSKNETIELPPGTIWGGQALINQQASRFDVLIKAHSEILCVDKSSIFKYEDVFRSYQISVGA